MRQDDEMLMRYADGELDEVARARVERAAAEDPATMVRLDEHRRLRARIAAHYAPVADELAPDRLTSLLAGNVVAIEPVRRRTMRLRWAPVAVAASLAAGVIAGQMLPRADGGLVEFEGDAMIAQGEMARALETQLASAQAVDAAVRIGVSFPGRSGRPCRTFDASAIAGVACRSDDRWQVLVTAPGTSARSAGLHAQAGSAQIVVMQAAQEMMTGEPFDAAAEKRARDAGWPRDVGANARRP